MAERYFYNNYDLGPSGKKEDLRKPQTTVNVVDQKELNPNAELTPEQDRWRQAPVSYQWYNGGIGVDKDGKEYPYDSGYILRIKVDGIDHPVMADCEGNWSEEVIRMMFEIYPPYIMVDYYEEGFGRGKSAQAAAKFLEARYLLYKIPGSITCVELSDGVANQDYPELGIYGAKSWMQRELDRLNREYGTTPITFNLYRGDKDRVRKELNQRGIKHLVNLHDSYPISEADKRNHDFNAVELSKAGMKKSGVAAWFPYSEELLEVWKKFPNAPFTPEQHYALHEHYSTIQTGFIDHNPPPEYEYTFGKTNRLPFVIARDPILS